MRKVLYSLAVLLLVSGMAFADISPYNSRPQPVAVGDGWTLQQILDDLYGINVVDVIADQEQAGMWQLTGGGAAQVTAPVIQFEFAGNATSNTFGIWSVLNPSLNTITMAPIFSGPASPGTAALLQWSVSDPNTLTVMGGPGVINDTYAGINRFAFGFYINGPGGVFYTADQLNGGNPQALTYRHGPTNRWTFAFEDVPVSGNADRDYNDFVVTTESLTTVPDGGLTLMLLGGALVGIETLRRKLRA